MPGYGFVNTPTDRKMPLTKTCIVILSIVDGEVKEAVRNGVGASFPIGYLLKSALPLLLKDDAWEIRR